MLYREIIAVCSEIRTKHINTVCGQNVGFVNVKPGGTQSAHYSLMVLITFYSRKQLADIFNSTCFPASW
jgi:hypothetical protein